MTANIHATCVRLDRAALFGAPKSMGVLLIGPSGAGKSETALRLIARGATLVADDRTEISLRGRGIFARAPAAIRGLIEVRGVGIIALPFAARARIGLVVRVGARGARLPAGDARWQPPDSAKTAHAHLPPQVSLPLDHATPERILAAAAAFSAGLFRDSAAG